MQACRWGHKEIVSVLLGHERCTSSLINAQDELGCTALFYAAAFGLPDVVKGLLVHGADSTIGRYQDGLTPLQAAEIDEEEPCIRLLQVRCPSSPARPRASTG
jgi:ankyrin repeat protein